MKLEICQRITFLLKHVKFLVLIVKLPNPLFFIEKPQSSVIMSTKDVWRIEKKHRNLNVKKIIYSSIFRFSAAILGHLKSYFCGTRTGISFVSGNFQTDYYRTSAIYMYELYYTTISIPFLLLLFIYRKLIKEKLHKKPGNWNPFISFKI